MISSILEKNNNSIANINELFTCLCCGHDKNNKYLERCNDRYLDKGPTIDYVKCSSCGMVQVKSVPPNIPAFYEDYPIHQDRSPIVEKIRTILIRPAYTFQSQIKPGQKLLDYGCGDGWYLKQIRKKNVTCFGFEMNNQHAEYLTNKTGIKVFSNSEKMLKELSGNLDWITMHFVLEHLSSPKRSLYQCYQLLKPGGQLSITIPNIHSWEAQIFKKNWHGLDAPRHLIFPQKKHIELLAKNLGFCLMKTQRIPFANTLAGSLATIPNKKFNINIFYWVYPFCVLSGLFFRSGNLRFILKK